MPKPVFLVVSEKMSKRYLNGGLQSSFSFIFGFSIKTVNISAVGFQKSPIDSKKIMRYSNHPTINPKPPMKTIMIYPSILSAFFTKYTPTLSHDG